MSGKAVALISSVRRLNLLAASRPVRDGFRARSPDTSFRKGSTAMPVAFGGVRAVVGCRRVASSGRSRVTAFKRCSGMQGSRALSGHSVEGMTVNERLFHLELLDRFDAAANARDIAAMTAVLVEARFSDEQAAQTARTIAGNPTHYGY